MARDRARDREGAATGPVERPDPGARDLDARDLDARDLDARDLDARDIDTRDPRQLAVDDLGYVLPAEPPSRGRRLRRRIVRVLRRVPSRTILMICFAMALVAVLLVTFPLTTTSSAGTELDCGPPLYEVTVPADPAFDVPENTGCLQPSRQRVALAALLFGAAFVIAVITQILARGETRYHHSRWLRGPRPSRKARKQRAAALAAAQARALDEVVAQGSTDARSRERNASAASSVSGPGARSTR